MGWQAVTQTGCRSWKELAVVTQKGWIIELMLTVVTQTSWSCCRVVTVTQSSAKDQNIITDPGILERINMS